MDPEEQQEMLTSMFMNAYNQGRADAIATIEESLTLVLGKGILDGDKEVGFSHAILLVSDTFELLGLERPE